MKLTSLLKIDETLVIPASVTTAEAFKDDPATLWTIPDVRKRQNLRYAMEPYLRIAAGGYGAAYTTSEKCEGVAAWVPAGQVPPGVTSLIRAGFPRLPLRCGWQYLLRNAAIDRWCKKLRKELAPERHTYLALLAVAPEHQGRGHASALLKPMLAKLDATGEVCYLETQTPRNAEMYKHFGFKTLKEVTTPRTGLPLWLMLRKPQT
ncbi:MAG: GNAT family N-acetyltransferase [Dehalococcoidia bacterium]|nr:GNAT family N-acetyltransferase [Dehalococcoidia bacterium]